MMKRMVMVGWAVMALAGPARALPAAGRVLTVDDFEDGDRRAASGLSWISISDDLMGGASHADLQVTAAGSGSGRALKVSGDVAANGFAGAWVALDGRSRATDVSDFTGLRLRVRGAGTLQLQLRAGPMPGTNYTAPVEARPEWRSVDVPFESLAAMRPGSPPFDPRTVRWLGVVVRPEPAGAFAFEVDDVQLYARRRDAKLRVQDGPTMTVPFTAAPPSEAPSGPWKELANDAPDDGKQKRLPDATSVAVCPDDAHGRLWFRVTLAGPIPDRWVGVNLALDVDGDPTDGMTWWGTNAAFKFDRLVSVYGSVTGAGYEGTLGIADAAEVQAGNFVGSKNEQVTLVLDPAGPALLVGIPRSALGTSTTPARVVAAVGSAFMHNDDVPNEGAAVLAR